MNSIFVTHVDNFSVEYISKDIEMVKGNKVTKSNIYRLHNLSSTLIKEWMCYIIFDRGKK